MNKPRMVYFEEDDVLHLVVSEFVNLSAVSLAASSSCGNIVVSRRIAHDHHEAKHREQV